MNTTSVEHAAVEKAAEDAAKKERKRESDRKWYEANREKVREQQREYDAANREKRREGKREYMREYRKANWEKTREIERKRHLAVEYGLTPEQHSALVAQHGGACHLCGEVPTGGRNGGGHVDHCHTTGKVRGWLCHRCNLGLGHFKDSPSRLEAAAAYLRAAR